ncbi:MAG: hypothetical protein Q8O57_08220, partial [Kiritimatiellota bacterium]|nr:hypothetical protein [Kiritimatiellota bacterium]
NNGSKSWTIVMAFMKTMISLRVPQDADLARGPVKLKAIKESDGWLGQNWEPKFRHPAVYDTSDWMRSDALWREWYGQNTNWNAYTGGYQKLPIAAYAEFSGDKARASWLPNENYARKWQEFHNTGLVENWLK